MNGYVFVALVAVVVMVSMGAGVLLAYEVGVYHRARYGNQTPPEGS